MVQCNTGRRDFLKHGVVAAGAATLGAGLFLGGVPLYAEEADQGRLTCGDAAILRFLFALETVKSDLWKQYAELGGATNQGVSPIDLGFTTGVSPDYTLALQQLDGDMPQ